MEELGQRYSAVISTGLYLKLNEYLSGQRGPLYLHPPSTWRELESGELNTDNDMLQTLWIFN